MAVRKSDAIWTGDLKSGRGEISLGSGAYKGAYSFQSRFEDGVGTNPEELIAAAHAGCFSMALSAALGKAGHNPVSVKTRADVHLEKIGEGFGITRIQLTNEAKVPELDEGEFQRIAASAKGNCPVSKALAAVPISLDAKLIC